MQRRESAKREEKFFISLVECPDQDGRKIDKGEN